MYDVYGLGNALVDLQVPVEHETLNETGHPPGSMILIDEAAREAILRIMGDDVMPCSGGSVANSMVGLAGLGGKPAFTGCIHEDDLGRSYSRSMEESGVAFRAEIGGRPSGTCIVLITPDGQRTMLTTLGCAADISQAGVCEETIASSRYIYVEGYLWDGTAMNACRHAMDVAKAKGVKIAFTASDSFCVERHLDDFRHILHERADVFFANADEAKRLADTDSTTDAAAALGKACPLVAVTDSENGAYIATADEVIHVPAHVITPVDTTGAGDAFAAGFLRGLTSGESLRTAAEAGVKLAAQVISHYGARPTF